MLALGASTPVAGGLRGRHRAAQRADASALLEYFAPLRAWLEKENAGRAVRLVAGRRGRRAGARGATASRPSG